MTPPDPFRRFVLTPVEIDISVAGATIRVQTNSQAVVDQFSRGLGPAAGGTAAPQLLCRVVTDPCGDPDLAPESAGIHRLVHDGLGFVRMGHRSFIAVDRGSQEVIAFIPESLTRDTAWFRDLFLPGLRSLVGELEEPCG